jgi:hypothetical protein
MRFPKGRAVGVANPTISKSQQEHSANFGCRKPVFQSAFAAVIHSALPTATIIASGGSATVAA